MDPKVIAKKADTRAVAFLADAKELVITTPAEYESSALMLRQVVGQRKTLETQRKDITGPMDEAKRGVMDLFRPVIARFQSAEDTLRDAALDFTMKEEEKRRREQARLDDLARKKEERLRAKAEEKREQGEEEKAEELEERSTQVVAREAAPVTRAAGVHARVTWHAEVTDLMELVKAVAAGSHAIGLLEPNMPALNALAVALKDTLDIPGVEAVKKTGMVT